MDNISFILAFSAGVLSFLSPCVLPLVPAYFSYLTGMTVSEINDNKARMALIYRALGFVAGFSIIFILMGVSVSALSNLILENKDILRKAGGIIIVIFGLHTAGVFRIKALYSERRLLPLESKGKSFGPVIVGMAFAAGWTPCIGPILSSILILAGSMETIWKGIFLLVAYSLGLAIPFILLAFAIDSLKNPLKKFSRYLPAVSIVSGVLMIIMGILVFMNKLIILGKYLDFVKIY